MVIDDKKFYRLGTGLFASAPHVGNVSFADTAATENESGEKQSWLWRVCVVFIGGTLSYILRGVKHCIWRVCSGGIGVVWQLGLVCWKLALITASYTLCKLARDQISLLVTICGQCFRNTGTWNLSDWVNVMTKVDKAKSMQAVAYCCGYVVALHLLYNYLW